MSSNERFYREWEARQNKKPEAKRPETDFRLLCIVLILSSSLFAAAKSGITPKKLWQTAHQKSEREKQFRTEIETQPIEIYGPEGNVLQLPIEAAAIRNLKVDIKVMRSPSDILDNPELKKEVEIAGAMRPEGFLLPIIRVGHRVLTESEMKAFYTLPGANMASESTQPYVHVFGVANCGYTTRLVDELKAKGIQFTYTDMNADRAMGAKAHAKFLASSSDPDNMQMPLVEVNGKILSRPEFRLINEIYTSRR